MTPVIRAAEEVRVNVFLVLHRKCCTLQPVVVFRVVWMLTFLSMFRSAALATMSLVRQTGYLKELKS